jgi:hypothetical protein
VLVLIGATEDGTKELLAVVDGYRESTQSSRELLGAAQTPGACWVLSQLPLCYPLLGIWYLVLVVLTGGESPLVEMAGKALDRRERHNLVCQNSGHVTSGYFCKFF